jgi:uncharacterized membrane protein
MDFWDDCQIIQVTILVAADGALKFPKITRPADLEAVLQKLNSIPAREIQVWRIFPIYFLVHSCF